MDFKKYLKTTAKKIDNELEKVLKKELKQAEKTDKKLVPLLKAFIKACSGGKGIRGTLVKLGFELAGGRSKEIIKVGSAYEILHSAILAHDDIIDQDLIRRGQPSLYHALGGNHYGISQSISLADYGFFLSYKIICQTSFPNNSKIKALNLFSKVMVNTTWGQMLDLEITDPIIVMKLKTACYTIEGPLQIGALLGGANDKLIGILGQFGQNLGISYQIQDDIFDSEVESVERAKKEADKYRNQALKLLPGITNSSEMSMLLEQMAMYLTERNK